MNRRTFVRVGTLGAAGMTASACRWFSAGSGAQPLDIQIKGLVMVERKSGAFTAHFLDPTKFPSQFMVVPHFPFLSVLASDIVSSSPDPLPVDDYDSNRRLLDLKDQMLTLDAGVGGPPGLTANDDAIGTTIPAAGQWQSIKYAARMPELCGATKISDTSRFFGSFTVEHGHLQSAQPSSDVGRFVVWTFTPPPGTPKPPVTQALTDTLVCRVNTKQSSATFKAGSRNVVVKVPATVIVRNLPPQGTAGVCHSGINPCVDHMALYYEVVDKQYVPTVSKTGGVPPGSSAEPDYCPPGSI